MPTRYYPLCAILACMLFVSPVFGQDNLRTLSADPALHQDVLGIGAQIPSLERRSIRDAVLASVAGPDAQLLIMQLSKSWDAGAEDWQDETRLTYTRNSSGISTGYLAEEWDEGSGAWVPSLRQVSTLDANNRATESLTEAWDTEANGGLGDWAPLSRISRTWNDQGRVLVSTTEYWDDGSGAYFIYSRSTNTYDASGTRVDQTVFESGLFGPLEPRLRYTFEYDGAGRTTRRFHETYDSGSGTFQNYGDRRWTYDSNGEEVEDLELRWNPATSGWDESYRTSTSYVPNSAGPSMITATEERWNGAWEYVERNILEASPSLLAPTEVIDTDQDWDPLANGGLGDWVNVDQNVTSVENLRPVISTYRTWDVFLGAWVDEDRETVEYDGEGNVVSSLGEVWDGSAWLNSTLLLMTYDEFSSVAVENDVAVDGFHLDANYPNPFSTTTTISFSVPTPEHVTIDIFDMLGRRVRTVLDTPLASGEHKVTVDADDLPVGLYVYRLNGEHFRASRSMLLVR